MNSEAEKDLQNTAAEAAAEQETPAPEEAAAETQEAQDTPETQEEAAEPGPELAALLREKEDLAARLLRLQADFDNYRRRSSKDNEDAIHRAAASLIGSILPVLDNFERAWNLMADGPDKDGVGLIARQLLSVLENNGLAEIPAEGADFDPNLHQAVAQTDAGPEQKGKVTAVLQKGYMLRDKLLRAAMVQVGM